MDNFDGIDDFIANTDLDAFEKELDQLIHCDDKKESFEPEKETKKEEIVTSTSITDNRSHTTLKEKNTLSSNNICGGTSNRSIFEHLKRKIQENKKTSPESRSWFGKGLQSTTKPNGTKLKASTNKLSSLFQQSINSLIDPLFSMRIDKPKLTAAAMKDMVGDRQVARPSDMAKFLLRPDYGPSDWVTGGCIINRIVKKSMSGSMYCQWKLSDLRGDIKYITLLLFGSACDEFKMLSVGTVVGVMTPGKVQNKDTKAEGTFKVDSKETILVLGTSADYGVCKSTRKDGEKCTNAVNKAICDYCIYHVQAAHKKVTGSGVGSGTGRTSGGEKGGVGKAFTVVSRVKNRADIVNAMRDQANGRRSIRERDQSLLKRLSSTPTPKNGKERVNVPTKEIEPIQQPNALTKKVEPIQQAPPKREVQVVSQKCPPVNTTVPVIQRTAGMSRAKLKALQFVRDKGPIQEPVREKTIKSPEQISAIKRKVESDRNDDGGGSAKKGRTDTDGLTEKQIRCGLSKAFFDAMNKPPNNPLALKQGEQEQEERYFETKMVREKIEEKMSATYKVPCKAVKCAQCKYTALGASDLCKKEKHQLRVVQAVKRFWKCHDCGARTISLDFIPLRPCRNCGSSQWDRASMLAEKKGPVLPSEMLSVRGDEEKFVGSTVANPNLNLLIPDEGTG